MMKTCVYDNPITMARECWCDGELKLHYQAEFLMGVVQPKINFIANIGDWKMGQYIGNLGAMNK